MWSHVNFTTLSLAGAAEILVRAKSVPLFLEANISSYRWDDVRFSIFRKELQEHVHHLRHLKTSAEPAQFHSILEGLISPAPTLEYLSLASRDGRRSRTTREQLLFIPDTLFDGSTPRLSWLKLCKCNISWRSPLLKGLKYLEISTLSTNARPNLAVWLDALDEMSQLKTPTLHSLPRLLRPFHLISCAPSHFLPSHAWNSWPLRRIVRSRSLISTYLPSPACAFQQPLCIRIWLIYKILYRMLRDTPMGRRTPCLCRACLSAVMIIAQTSLRGPCPISATCCTTHPT